MDKIINIEAKIDSQTFILELEMPSRANQPQIIIFRCASYLSMRGCVRWSVGQKRFYKCLKVFKKSKMGMWAHLLYPRVLVSLPSERRSFFQFPDFPLL